MAETAARRFSRRAAGAFARPRRQVKSRSRYPRARAERARPLAMPVMAGVRRVVEFVQ
jgi:hypothetical protein